MDPENLFYSQPQTDLIEGSTSWICRATRMWEGNCVSSWVRLHSPGFPGWWHFPGGSLIPWHSKGLPTCCEQVPPHKAMQCRYLARRQKLVRISLFLVGKLHTIKDDFFFYSVQNYFWLQISKSFNSLKCPSILSWSVCIDLERFFFFCILTAFQL